MFWRHDLIVRLIRGINVQSHQSSLDYLLLLDEEFWQVTIRTLACELDGIVLRIQVFEYLGSILLINFSH